MYYTYILRSRKNGRLYTGATDDLRKRFKLHNEGRNKSTQKDRPYELVYYEACSNREDAFVRERFLKQEWVKDSLKID